MHRKTNNSLADVYLWHGLRLKKTKTIGCLVKWNSIPGVKQKVADITDLTLPQTSTPTVLNNFRQCHIVSLWNFQTPLINVSNLYLIFEDWMILNNTMTKVWILLSLIFDYGDEGDEDISLIGSHIPQQTICYIWISCNKYLTDSERQLDIYFVPNGQQ